jgi:peptide chain release factor subunit 1
MSSTIGILKTYKKPPKNGLAIFCGLVEYEGKEKKIVLGFEPLFPITQGFYLCDNKFHVNVLLEQLKSSEKSFGFIVCNGDGTLFGKANGEAKEVILMLKDPNLPKKHNKGGQSASRFARITEESRHVYLKKVAESACKVFIKNNVPNVTGIFISGSGPLKYKLLPYLDKRIENICQKQIFDTSYGGNLGFQHSVEMASTFIENHKYLFETQLVQDFMKEISLNTGKYVFGMKETMNLIDMGFASKVILSETMTGVRVVTEKGVQYFKNEGSINDKNGIIEKMNLVDYLVEREDLDVEIVSDSTSEGKQFLQGFGGLGAFLKFQYNPLDEEMIQLNLGKEEDEQEEESEYNDDLSEFM